MGINQNNVAILTAAAAQPQLQLHNPVLNSNSAPSPANPQELPALPVAAVPQAAYSEESNKRKPDSSSPKKSSKGGKKRFKSRLLAREYDLSVNSSSANTSGEWTSSSDQAEGGADVGAIMNEWEDKKEAKRAANRLSAHLSRKRKKIMVEELRAEIRELRRKEMILKSIPDGVVSFDSSGTVLYANAFASGLLGRDPEEEGESCALWDVVCPASAIGIKSAFMDALAKKDRGHNISCEGGGTPSKQDSHSVKAESDVDGDDPVYTLVPLSDEPLRVKFASGEEMFLRGTVHFSDSAPHCVCMICPIEGRDRQTSVGGRQTAILPTDEEISAAGKQVSSDSDVDKI